MIQVSSPTRVDLAGGTLDLWPLYLFLKRPAQTVNVAIDIMTHARITPKSDSEIELVSVDLKLEKKYPNLQAALSDNDERLSLLQTQLAYFQPERGFRLETSSESPVGGGLGGSSSLTISLMKAFSQFTGKKFSSVHQMVNVAHNIEAQVLNTPTGTQDYYPAASGGLNFLNYNIDGIHQETIEVETSPLAQHFLLVNTGRSHHSGMNNFEVMKAAVNKDQGTIKALSDLSVISDEMAKVCKTQQWDRLPDLFNQEFEARVRLAPAFSSPEIINLQRITRESGADAVKICGAGGGGCVLVWVKENKRSTVVEQCQKNGFQVLNAKPKNPLPA